MIRVTALTAYRDDPASRFRIRQFIGPLAHLGIDVSEHYLPITRYRRQPLASLAILMRLHGVAASRFSDITWFRRELVPERFTLERFTGGRRIFDVDDAIWLLRDSGFSEKIVALCDGVIAGNQWLASHYEKLGKQLWIVPTSVDTDVWVPATTARTNRWIIGWIGTASNLRYLQMIEEPLAQFLNQHPGTLLRVVCDRRPGFRLIPPELWEFIKWSPGSEVQSMQAMSVGLMPLEDSQWALGKCAFKMLLYMACGLPVVASPVGVNRELLQREEIGFAALTPDDWFASLHRLFADQALSSRLGTAGRKLVEAEYSVKVNILRLAKIFQQVSRGGG
jgi:glycosyl transferase family 1